MFNIGNIKIKNPFFLAPMAGVTDRSFRTICKDMGAGFLFSEFVSSEGIIRDNAKTNQYMEFNDYERPIGIQIFGNNPDSMSKSAKIIENKLKPETIDLNFGCPVKKVVKKGAGASLMKNIDLLIEIAEKVVNAVKIPVTAKIRAGWDNNTLNAVEVAIKLEKIGISAITIHPRTAVMGYSGKSNWSIIKEIKKSVQVPIIGNGDVKNSIDAVKMFNETNCDAVMIGRGVLGNPWIFRELNENIKIYDGKIEIIENNFPHPSYLEIFSTMKKHLHLIAEYYPERIACNMFKSHFAWYTKGMINATTYRSKINHSKSLKETKNTINLFEKYTNSISI